MNSIRGNSTRFLGLCALAGFLLCSLGAQAQTYTPNDIYTIAGGGPVPTTPLTLDLAGPTSAIKDTTGNIYFASQDSGYVYKLSTKGTVSVFAGKGYGGYSGDGKAATTALIGGVAGLAIDSKGNIYFADAVGTRVREVTAAGIISTVAGTGTKCDLSEVCGDGGPAASAELNLPESVAVDGAGNVYIADMTDNRIRVVNTGAATITIAGVSIAAGDIQTVVGTGQPCTDSQGTAPTCGDGGAANKATLTMPYGVAVDGAGNIYIADTRDQEIRIVAAGQNNIATFAGNGLSCFNQHGGCGDGGPPTSALLWAPRGVFTDAAGDVYIADTSSNRIRYIAKGSNVITTLVDSTGGQGFAGDTGAATAALVNGPVGIFADSFGNLLVSDTGNQRIREVTSGTTPTINTIIGGGTGGDGGLPTAAKLADPWDVAEFGGSLYVVDQGNNRIRKITHPGTSTAVISTVAGTGNAGYTGDGGLAIDATLNAPTGIAFDTLGNLYIVDSNNLVVREVSATTGDINTVFGNDTLSCAPTAKCGDGGPPLKAIFQEPLFVALDASNNVYVTDYEGSKIREWNITSDTVSTVAGTGRENYKGNGGPATAADLNHPAGIVINSSGEIIFSDQWDDIVQDVSGGILNIFALDTAAKFVGDGGVCPKGSMYNPLALAIDPAGDVFISGGNDNVVQRCSFATGIFSNVAGNPVVPYQGGYTGDGGPATDARMENLGTWVDAENNLYIADGGNNRVRYVPLAAAVTFGSTSLFAGQWPLGEAGTAVPLTVKGAGGADLTSPKITFTGANASNFSVSSNNCPALISPQVSCTVDVVVTPSAYGEVSATMTFTDNGIGSPQTLPVTGWGPDFAIADSPTTVSVAPGAAGTSTVSLTPQAKFAQAISLTCPSGLPTGATCSFSPASVQLYGASTQQSTLTIQTSSTTPAGTYTLTTTGVYGVLSHSATITLTVQ